ncbi:hypothetical protein C3L33_14766, partial [Rhododendron williamsianum]
MDTVFKLKKSARPSLSSSSPPDWASFPEELLELILHPGDDRRRLYSVTENKILSSLELRVPYRRRCCGSSHGWLATVNEEDSGITLLNPFSGRALSLPKVGCEPYNINPAMRHNLKYEYDVKKVILSCGDPSSDEFVVVAIYSMCNALAYIKPGRSKHWIKIKGGNYSDAIYHQGIFYVMDKYSGVLYLDVRDYSEPKGRLVVNHTTRRHPFKAYIVVLSTGKDLLLVERFLKKKGRPARWVTSSFKIFKLGFVCGSGSSISGGSQQFAKEWVEINSLGDDTLFLGDNYSLSVTASSFPGCQANCVYYTDDVYTDTSAPWYPYGPRDMGIYSFVDGSLAPHYEFKKKQMKVPMPPPIWIVPTLL